MLSSRPAVRSKSTRNRRGEAANVSAASIRRSVRKLVLAKATTAVQKEDRVIRDVEKISPWPGKKSRKILGEGMGRIRNQEGITSDWGQEARSPSSSPMFS